MQNVSLANSIVRSYGKPCFKRLSLKSVVNVSDFKTHKNLHARLVTSFGLKTTRLASARPAFLTTSPPKTACRKQQTKARDSKQKQTKISASRGIEPGTGRTGEWRRTCDEEKGDDAEDDGELE